jgi:hypothetical protein
MVRLFHENATILFSFLLFILRSPCFDGMIYLLPISVPSCRSLEFKFRWWWIWNLVKWIFLHVEYLSFADASSTWLSCWRRRFFPADASWENVEFSQHPSPEASWSRSLCAQGERVRGRLPPTLDRATHATSCASIIKYFSECSCNLSWAWFIVSWKVTWHD